MSIFNCIGYNTARRLVYVSDRDVHKLRNQHGDCVVDLVILTTDIGSLRKAFVKMLNEVLFRLMDIQRTVHDSVDTTVLWIFWHPRLYVGRFTYFVDILVCFDKLALFNDVQMTRVDPGCGYMGFGDFDLWKRSGWGTWA